MNEEIEMTKIFDRTSIQRLGRCVSALAEHAGSTVAAFDVEVVTDDGATILQVTACAPCGDNEVCKRFGTFASYPAIKAAMTDTDLDVYERVRSFYGDEVAACFMAPLYPDASRNNAWLLRRAGDN